MVKTTVVPKAAPEKCPGCGASVLCQPTENGNHEPVLALYNLDGSRHICPQDKKPIGREVEGKVVKAYSLRDRRLSITFDDDSVLEIEANGTPLHMRLLGQGKILTE